MFQALTDKLHNIASLIGKNKTLNEDNISDAVRQVRMALLEADVNYSVASSFVKRVKEKALGKDLIKSVKPKEQFIKIVHDELIDLMGSEEVLLQFEGRPSSIMLCGLQGSGKTTHAAKLAQYIRQTHGKKVLLVACDLQRPAAIEQLKALGSQIETEVFFDKAEKSAVKLAKQALKHATNEKFDVVIFDTAGRLHVDEALMKELKEIKKVVDPKEVLFVANGATGQDAVKTAEQFNQTVEITGSILTMLDGDAKAGAAISILEVTKKPLKFEGVGEKISDLQVFNPKSMADRILGMGDVINLVKKAESAFDEEESKKLEKKLKKASFTYADYLKQMGMIRKMGSFKSILKMMPGMGAIKDLNVSDDEFKKMEAIILSMTPNEREEKDELSHSRRRRVAKGAGVKVEQVNRLVKGFKRIKQLFKKMPNMKKQGMGLPNLGNIQETMGKMKWR